MSTEAVSPYDYSFDPSGDSTAARIVRMVGSDRTVLEFGCGYGVISRAMHERGCKIVGLELDVASAQAAKPWLEELILENLEHSVWRERLQGRAFDVVLASDVIEHLRNPSELLSHLHALLAPEGDLVLSVPNIGHAGIIAELLCGAFDYRPTGILDNTHLRFFTWTSLERLLNDAGFEVYHRETVTASGSHEHFHHYWMMLPAHMRADLDRHPTATVFQYLLKARRSAAPRVLETDDTASLEAWIRSVCPAARATEMD